MPLIEAAFFGADGRPDEHQLIQYGPTVQVVVSHYVDGRPAADPPPQTVFAVIDTGATRSCIDEDMAIALKLPIVDTCELGGAAGSKQHNVYLAHIFLPKLELDEFGTFAGVQMSVASQKHHVLLGRTFLKDVIMIYDGVRSQVSIACAKKQ